MSEMQSAFDAITSSTEHYKRMKAFEAEVAEQKRLDEIPDLLVAQRKGKVKNINRHGEVIEHMVFLKGIQGEVFLRIQESNASRLKIETLPYTVEITMPHQCVDEAAEWIESNTKSDWSIAQRVSKTERRGPYVFTFASKEAAALFTIAFVPSETY